MALATEQQKLNEFMAVSVITNHTTKSGLIRLERMLKELFGLGLSVGDLRRLVEEINDSNAI